MSANQNKDTPLGLLPDDWEIVQFQDTILSRRINVGKVKRQEYLATGIYPVIDQSQGYIAGYSNNESLVYQGDLPVVIFGDHTRVFKYVDFPFICGADGTKVLLPNRELVEPEYYYYCLSNLVIPSKGYNRHFKLLKEQLIPLPPLPEQRAIAHILSTVRQAIESTERVIAAAKELKRSMMKHLFTYGPVPIDQADQVPLKVTEIGEVPEGWEVRPLEHIIEGGGSIQTGPFGSLLHASDYVLSGIPFVMPKDLSEDARIIQDTIANIGESDFERLSKYHLQPGDVITARRGEIGRRALVTENENGWVCGTGCLRLRPGEKLLPNFLSQALGTTELRTWLLDNAVGSTMPNLSGRVLAQLPFPFPQHVTQKKIGDYLSIADDKISVETQSKFALEALFNSLLHHLMMGKIRVSQLVDKEGLPL